MIRISVVAAANTAFVVMLVASIALGVTLSLANYSLRRLSLAHAESLADSTLFALSESFDLSARQVQTWNNNSIRFYPTGTPPCKDPLFMQRLSDATLMAFMASGSNAVSAGIVWQDLSRFVSFHWGTSALYGYEAVWPDAACLPSPWCHTVKLWTSNVSSPVPHSGNESQLGLSSSRQNIANGYQQIIYNTGGGRNTFWTSPLIYGTTDGTFYSVDVISPLRFPNNTAFGFGIISQSIEGMSDIVRKHTLSGGAGFVVDVFGYLLGSSLSASFVNITRVPYGTVVSQAKGCDSFNSNLFGLSSVASSETQRTTQMVMACRSSVKEYPYDPLNALAAADFDFFWTTTRQSMYFSVGSGPTADGYFAVADQVKNRFPNLNMFVVIIMPEREVSGDLRAGTNLSIGIAVAVMLVVSLLSIALVSAVLAPLRDVAHRLSAESPIPASSSSSEDGSGATDERSAASDLPTFSELVPLVLAYRAMQAELSRIRAYIPRAALTVDPSSAVVDSSRATTRYGDGEVLGQQSRDQLEQNLSFDLCDDRSTATSSRRGGLRRSSAVKPHLNTKEAFVAAKASSRARVEDPHRAPGTDDDAPPNPTPRVRFNPMVRVSSELRPAEAALLAVDVLGFHRVVCRLMGPEQMPLMVAKFAAFLWQHVTEGWGTVQSMHGDRVLAVFSALPRRRRPLARALACGVAMLSEAKACYAEFDDRPGFAGLRLGLGVDHGVVLTGPAGSDGATSMHVMGRCVTSAFFLCGLAKLYRRVAVYLPLNAARQVGEQQHLSTTIRALDAVRLPAGGTLHVAEAYRADSTDDVDNATIVAGASPLDAFYDAREQYIRSIGAPRGGGVAPHSGMLLVRGPAGAAASQDDDDSLGNDAANSVTTIASADSDRSNHPHLIKLLHDMVRCAPCGDVARVEIEDFLARTDVVSLHQLYASGRWADLDTRQLLALVSRVVPRVPLAQHSLQCAADVFAPTSFAARRLHGGGVRDSDSTSVQDV